MTSWIAAAAVALLISVPAGAGVPVLGCAVFADDDAFSIEAIDAYLPAQLEMNLVRDARADLGFRYEAVLPLNSGFGASALKIAASYPTSANLGRLRSRLRILLTFELVDGPRSGSSISILLPFDSAGSEGASPLFRTNRAGLSHPVDLAFQASLPDPGDSNRRFPVVPRARLWRLENQGLETLNRAWARPGLWAAREN